jgi:two-component system response regulator
MDVQKWHRPPEILLVEDDAGDVLLIRRAFTQGGITVNLTALDNGVDAVDFLRGRGNYSRAAKPDLIFLDLNLPRKDGREVLAEIKADAQLTHIPVVILTTTDAKSEIMRTYRLHANSFVTKPSDFHQFLRTVQSIANYWLTICTLP